MQVCLMACVTWNITGKEILGNVLYLSWADTVQSCYKCPNLTDPKLLLDLCVQSFSINSISILPETSGSFLILLFSCSSQSRSSAQLCLQKHPEPGQLAPGP